MLMFSCSSVYRRIKTEWGVYFGAHDCTKSTLCIRSVVTLVSVQTTPILGFLVACPCRLII